MGVAVTVVFTGLCALVTGGDRAPGQVLLVDAKGVGPVGGVELPQHAPTLLVSLASLANAATSNPTRVVVAWPDGAAAAGATPDGGAAAPVNQVGLWDLAGSEVRVRVQGEEGTGLRLFRPSDGTSSWPEPPKNVHDAGSWRDLRYLADMGALAADGRIDPALVGTGDAAGGSLPPAVAARIYLDGGRLEAGIPSLATSGDAVFEFRDGRRAPRLRQALTDTMRWSLESDAAAVVVEIIPVAGGPVKRLVLKPGATPHSLFVSNLPAENTATHAQHAVSDEEMAALHFGVYYELLGSKPTERPLPRLRREPLPRQGTGFMGGMFCPPAVFPRN